jgi:hypothetical protein
VALPARIRRPDAADAVVDGRVDGEVLPAIA